MSIISQDVIQIIGDQDTPPEESLQDNGLGTETTDIEDTKLDKPKQKNKKGIRVLNPHRITKPFRPIIMSFVLLVSSGFGILNAQVQGSIVFGAQYTDNIFALSDYDFERFDQNNSLLDFVETTDDLNLNARINLQYPMRYRWWRFVPSVSLNASQSVSNQDKHRSDLITRIRVERYHWNATLLYGYYPYIYVRDYVDSDGTGELEKYSYERSLYRGDANLRITRATTLRLHARYEDYFYNEYWTQFDGSATTYGIGFRQSFPVFFLSGMYYYRVFDNDYDGNPLYNDSSYESNKIDVGISLKHMPLNESKKNGPTWRPTLDISYEERFYQGLDNWYGGRIDKMYNTKAGIDFSLSEKWNLSLDYSHVFRNVDSPNQSVLRLKEYSDNRVGTSVRYNF